mmetsp:Transcript_23833/g.39279  ORF Transcript_23833/g.39279 Transcript_23833/m.39279 type:complete len:271 (-) Transcript_23833:303-1115(-)
MFVPSIMIFFTKALPCLSTFLSISPVSSVKSSLHGRLIEISVSFSTKARTSVPTVESSKLQLTRESSFTYVFSSTEPNNASQLASSNPRPSRIRDVREGSLNLSSRMRSSTSSSLIFLGCSNDFLVVTALFHLLEALDAELSDSSGCESGLGFVMLCFSAFAETAATAPRFHLSTALVGEDNCCGVCGSGAALTVGECISVEVCECKISYFVLISAIRRSFSSRSIDLSFIKDWISARRCSSYTYFFGSVFCADEPPLPSAAVAAGEAAM